jgi:hypothetical protein
MQRPGRLGAPTLLSNVEPLGPILVFVPAAEKFAENRVVRLLDTLGLDMPAGKVVLEDTHEALFGIVAMLRAVITGFQDLHVAHIHENRKRAISPAGGNGFMWLRGTHPKARSA